MYLKSHYILVFRSCGSNVYNNAITFFYNDKKYNHKILKIIAKDIIPGIRMLNPAIKFNFNPFQDLTQLR